MRDGSENLFEQMLDPFKPVIPILLLSIGHLLRQYTPVLSPCRLLPVSSYEKENATDDC
jgi:hypothetical protein